MMFGVLKREFAVKKLSLSIENSSVLKESWILPPWAFLLLRSTMAMFCIAITLVSSIQLDSPKWFIFLTIWSYVTLTLNFIGLSIITLLHIVQQSKERQVSNTGDTFSNCETHLNNEINQDARERNEIIQGGNEEDRSNRYDLCEEKPYIGKFLRLLWILSADCSFFVTLIYWPVVFRPPTFFIDVALHALNSIFTLTELLTGLVPVNLLHVVYGMCFLVVYAIFTLIYWGAGGLGLNGRPYIYKILDYENGNHGLIAGTAIISLFIVLPLVQLLLFGLYHLRCYLKNKVFYPDTNGYEPNSGNVISA